MAGIGAYLFWFLPETANRSVHEIMEPWMGDPDSDAAPFADQAEPVAIEDAFVNPAYA